MTEPQKYLQPPPWSRQWVRIQQMRARGLCQCGAPSEKYWKCARCRWRQASRVYLRKVATYASFRGTLHVIGEATVAQALERARTQHVTLVCVGQRLFRVRDGAELDWQPRVAKQEAARMRGEGEGQRRGEPNSR